MASASLAPLQAAWTIARSKRCLAAKMPGVSTKTSWTSSRTRIPRSRLRVVWTLGVTIATLAPTSRLTRVDLPTLGAPRTATKPARVPPSAIVIVAGSGDSREQRAGRVLLCRALCGAGGDRTSEPGDLCLDLEERTMGGAAGGQHAVDR